MMKRAEDDKKKVEEDKKKAEKENASLKAELKRKAEDDINERNLKRHRPEVIHVHNTYIYTDNSVNTTSNTLINHYDQSIQYVNSKMSALGKAYDAVEELTHSDLHKIKKYISDTTKDLIDNNHDPKVIEWFKENDERWVIDRKGVIDLLQIFISKIDTSLSLDEKIDLLKDYLRTERKEHLSIKKCEEMKIIVNDLINDPDLLATLL
jgi:hypothetical protein